MFAVSLIWYMGQIGILLSIFRFVAFSLCTLSHYYFRFINIKSRCAIDWMDNKQITGREVSNMFFVSSFSLFSFSHDMYHNFLFQSFVYTRISRKYDLKTATKIIWNTNVFHSTSETTTILPNLLHFILYFFFVLFLLFLHWKYRQKKFCFLWSSKDN